jgi:hypothetical protein
MTSHVPIVTFCTSGKRMRRTALLIRNAPDIGKAAHASLPWSFNGWQGRSLG